MKIERLFVDVIFNEKVTYKDKDNTYTRNFEKSGTLYVDVDDVLETLIIDTPQPEQSIESSNDQQPDTPDSSTQIPALRRSTRPHKPNRKYLNYILLTDEMELENYEEACQTSYASK